MNKKLTRTGNSLALIFDRPLLEQTGISEDTPLEVSTDGDVIVITPVRSSARGRKIRRALDEIHADYAGVFKRLSK